MTQFLISDENGCIPATKLVNHSITKHPVKIEKTRLVAYFFAIGWVAHDQPSSRQGIGAVQFGDWSRLEFQPLTQAGASRIGTGRTNDMLIHVIANKSA